MELYDDCGSGSDTSVMDAQSYITSATDLSSTTDAFAAWAHKVRLDTTIEVSIPSAEIFEPIRDLQAASKVLPDWLRYPDSPEYGSMAPSHYEWRDRLCLQLQAIGSTYSYGADKDPSLPYAILIMFQICRHHQAVRLLNYYEVGSKPDLRVCIDALITHYCDNTAGLLQYCMEQKLRLPACPGETTNMFTIRTGGVIMIPIPNFSPYVLNFDLLRASTALVGNSEILPDLLLVHCVVEFGTTASSENHMKMGIVSALHQKKVLGIQDQFVFGIFQPDMDFLQVNAGRWEQGEIKIYKVGAYSLRCPSSLVGIYPILRGISRLAVQYKEQLLSTDLDLSHPAFDNPPIDEWAPMERFTNEGTSEESNDSESQPGLSPALLSLGQWGVDNRIDVFRQSISDFDSPEDLDIAH
ncbi:unnamed protein product [Rhizoctonia solani]|uniref:Uncharacterized protein n=1 Tax=Rhizoctonia solani TaxID=456999 RepID=A0A8H3HYA5_9AGAM|nr:unnamed protein product [Rhizoctonia solani]